MICVSTTKEKRSSPLALYNHCPSPSQPRWMFLWISLLVFQSQATSQSSWWLWTKFLSMLIFAPYPTLLHPFWWLNLSWTKSSNCMACPLPLCLIVTRSSLVTFGRNFFKLQGTQIKLSTSYHPQIDDQTEVINKCLENYLRCFTSEKQHQWV